MTLVENTNHTNICRTKELETRYDSRNPSRIVSIVSRFAINNKNTLNGKTLYDAKKIKITMYKFLE